MSDLSEKKAIFDSFFLIQHPTRVNLIKASQEQASQDLAAFEASMPYAFKIASELSEIESQALKPLRSLGEKLNELVNYLQLQAKKIDLMMSYILLNEDDDSYAYEATKFGAGGIVVLSTDEVTIGDSYTIKIFLESEAAAVYCLGEVIECQPKDDLFEVSYVYTHIREHDQELLVRASLHLQTSQLRKNKKDKST